MKQIMEDETFDFLDNWVVGTVKSSEITNLVEQGYTFCPLNDKVDWKQIEEYQKLGMKVVFMSPAQYKRLKKQYEKNITLK